MQTQFLSISQTCTALSIGRTKLYSLIREGEIISTKIGRRTVIHTRCIEAFVERAMAEGVI